MLGCLGSSLRSVVFLVLAGLSVGACSREDVRGPEHGPLFLVDDRGSVADAVIYFDDSSRNRRVLCLGLWSDGRYVVGGEGIDVADDSPLSGVLGAEASDAVLRELLRLGKEIERRNGEVAVKMMDSDDLSIDIQYGDECVNDSISRECLDHLSRGKGVLSWDGATGRIGADVDKKFLSEDLIGLRGCWWSIRGLLYDLRSLAIARRAVGGGGHEQEFAVHWELRR